MKKNCLPIHLMLLCFLAIPVNPALGWQSPINTYLAALTDLGPDSSFYSYRQDFIDGADEPDRRRREKPWLASPDHKAATNNATNAYQAAIKAFNTGDKARAARYLGQAAYFLQDLADPTGFVADASYAQYKDEIRQAANQEIVKIHREAVLKQYRTSYWSKLAEMNKQLENADWQALTNLAETSKNRITDRIQKTFHDYGTGAGINIADDLQLTFATIVACQNRLISLYRVSTGQPAAPVQSPEQQAIAVTQARMAIVVWDASCEDGDLIDLSINGITYLSNYALTKAKKTISADLAEGKNILEIFAVNSGTDCPPKAKHLTHASIGLSISGPGLKDINETWLIPQGKKKQLEITVTAP